MAVAVGMVSGHVSRTSRRMRLLLPPDGFAIGAVRAQARREHRSLSSLMGAAVRRYVTGLEARRPASRFPDFARIEEADEDAPEYELTVDSRVWESFSDEAERQDVTAEVLATHAALMYVADRAKQGPEGPDEPALPPLPPG